MNCVGMDRKEIHVDTNAGAGAGLGFRWRFAE
jgi:hypothetical protein